MTIQEILDRPIAYHRIFVTLTGSVTAAVMLSQALYWSSRTKDIDGWFYKVQSEWEEETGLSRREQETAREKSKRYLETELRGIPAQLYYRVNLSVLEADLIGDNSQTSMAKSAKQAGLNEPNINKNPEITAETTAEKDNTLQPKRRLTVEEYKAKTLLAMNRGIMKDQITRDAIVDCFHISPNFNSRTWSPLIAFLKERPSSETVEKFADWWYTQDWRGKTGAPPSAMQIRELWPQAFTEQQHNDRSLPEGI